MRPVSQYPLFLQKALCKNCPKLLGVLHMTGKRYSGFLASVITLMLRETLQVVIVVQVV